MKTFKLISLDVLEDIKSDIVSHNIPLLDGLIIDREDEKSQWVLECLLDQSYSKYFSNIKKKNDAIMLQAKITKETNKPATFMSSIIEINDIKDHVSILFLGKIIDLKKGQIEQTLKALIEEGYQGDQLLNEFKDRV
ncbi:YwpF-like family protein [Aquibacillus saliphilus]|uniref:YwpF-like family protein n=1 Tax=Aquibacillus saliphilus TaxID=1909422 RepID=UPI001CF07F9E|nr:YwpF-like family protein [Aquibacillus saliphilus]